MTQAVVLKSKRNGIHLVLNPDMEYDTLRQEVIQKFEDASDFFRGARVGMSFEGFPLTSEQKYDLIAVIEAHTNLHVVCILEDDKIEEAFILARAEEHTRSQVMENARVYRGNVEDGQQLQAQHGLLIVGNVEKGAKVYAGGSIVIFGSLDGFAQAGQYGDSAAYIAALSIHTKQLQIGNILFIPTKQEEGGEEKRGFFHRRKKKETENNTELLSPQIARVLDGHVIMEPYTKDLFL